MSSTEHEFYRERDKRVAVAMSRRGGSPMEALVVIPACDEAQTIGAAVAAVQEAAREARILTHLVVVADCCTDDTAQRAYASGARVLCISANNVGAARAAGFAAGLKYAARPEELWLATTDADSRVPRHWLTQLEEYRQAGSDAVVGTVSLDRVEGDDPLGERWAADYDRSIDQHHHDHIHGANLAFTASAYLAAGGFRSLASDEDVDLIGRLRAIGLTVTTAVDIPVHTSRRTCGRVARGFGRTLGGFSQ